VPPCPSSDIDERTFFDEALCCAETNALASACDKRDAALQNLGVHEFNLYVSPQRSPQSGQ
jgi:hypothetical protein